MCARIRWRPVGGQTQQDAIATLQSHGFKIRGPVQQSDPSVPIGYVINTDPGPDTALAGGDEITVTVSSGPDQRRVRNCANLTVNDCVRRWPGRVDRSPCRNQPFRPIGDHLESVAGQPDHDAEPHRHDLPGSRALPTGPRHGGALFNGGDIPGPDGNKNRVVKQDPPSGTYVNRDGTITLSYDGS